MVLSAKVKVLRDDFIGFNVNSEFKRGLISLAKKSNVSLSDYLNEMILKKLEAHSIKIELSNESLRLED